MSDLLLLCRIGEKMCKFCENIPEYHKYIDSTHSWDRKSTLVKDKTGVHFYNSCGDYYYSGIVLSNLNICPYCGRKFTENLDEENNIDS